MLLVDPPAGSVHVLLRLKSSLLGLAYIGAVLCQAGCKVKIADLSVGEAFKAVEILREYGISVWASFIGTLLSRREANAVSKNASGPQGSDATNTAKVSFCTPKIAEFTNR